MNQSSNGQNPPTPSIFWIIWFAIFNGLFILLFFAAGGIPKGSNEGDAPLLFISIAGALAVISMGIRFLVIPKIQDITKLLTAMIIGVALAESIGILGMFAVSKDFPETRLALFITSVSAVLAFAPFYVHSLSDRQKMK